MKTNRQRLLDLQRDCREVSESEAIDLLAKMLDDAEKRGHNRGRKRGFNVPAWFRKVFGHGEFKVVIGEKRGLLIERVV